LTDIRQILENAYHAGLINILCATSTLAAGVNLPARRVILRSPHLGRDFLTIGKYKQMSGRAGRAGYDDQGESICICKAKDEKAVLKLINSEIPPVQSALTESKRGLRRALLEVIAVQAVQTKADVKRFLESTLLAKQNGLTEVEKIAESALEYLLKEGFVNKFKEKRKKVIEIVDEGDPDEFLEEAEKKTVFEEVECLEVTNLGKATFTSQLGPEDGLYMFQELKEARQNGLVLSCTLHYCYLVTPVYVKLEPKWGLFYSIFDTFDKEHRRVAKALKIEKVQLFLWSSQQPRYQSEDPLPTRYRRFWTALLLEKILDETPFCRISTTYGVDEGQLQSLQSTATNFAGMIAVFSQCLKYVNLAAITAHFTERLKFGVKPELLELLQLTEVKYFQRVFRTLQVKCIQF